MMIIATIGLLANLLSAFLLLRKSDVKGNLNVRSAYLHILGDALGSVGALVAGLLMNLFGWYIADPIISVFVAVLILRGAWGVIKNTVHILMEGTPSRLNFEEVKAGLEGLSGVADVHDLHIWTISSGLDALSCHLKVRKEHAPQVQSILAEASELLEHSFGISHTTIQIETDCTWHEQLSF